MATYLIKNKFTITRQEGDISDVVFDMQAAMSLTGLTVKFQVINSLGTVLLSKTSADGGITVTGQQIVIPLLSVDTEGRSGTHAWEMELTGSGVRITVGQGDFVIVKTNQK